jgi:hypothetical protein
MEPVRAWIDTDGYEHPGWIYRSVTGETLHWDEGTIEDHQHCIDFLTSFTTRYDLKHPGAPDLPWQGPTGTPEDQQIAAHREAIIRLQAKL